MSPRRPRVPRVDPSTGAPRRAAPTPQPTPAPAGTSAPEPAARPATAEVIDLQRVQDRRHGAHGAPERGPQTQDPDAQPAPTSPARSRPPASAARPAARRPRPAPRRAATSVSAAARRRAPLPDPVPARQITGRSLVVLAVLLVAAVLVAPTLRAFLNQQLEISATQEKIASLQTQRQDYEERLRLWDEPGYVTQQARERLELVMPGETLYFVTGRPPGDAPDPAPEAPVGEPVNTRLPWVEGLWDSAVRAGLE